MKKLISLVLAAALLLGVTACSSLTDEAAETTENTESTESTEAGAANPITEMTAEALLSATGIDLTALSSYENVSFSTIAGEPVIAQAKFTKDGKDYTYRIAVTDADTDISGMYYTWTTTQECEVSYNTAKVMLADEGAGVISWYDAAPGLAYSLSVSENADADELVSLANELFIPTQGDSDGDMITGDMDADLTSLLAEIRKSQTIGAAGSSMVALSNAAAFANVVSAYDTNLDELKAVVTRYAASLDAVSFETFSEQFNMVSGAFAQFSEETVGDILESVDLELDTTKWDYELISNYLSQCAIAISETTLMELEIPAAYQEILDLYVENLSAKADWETLENASLNPLVSYNTEDYRDTLGYALTDIDGDSVLELVIGFAGEEADPTVLDLFTLNENQEARLVFRSAERDSYRYLGNAKFIESGSSGADDSFETTYSYASGILTEINAEESAEAVLIEMTPFAMLEDSADAEG